MDDRERRERNRHSGPAEINIRDPVFGKPKAIGEGKYEVNASVAVFVNNRPARDFYFAFMVDGMPSGNAQLISEGVASAVIEVKGKRVYIGISLVNTRMGIVRLIPIKEIDVLALLEAEVEKEKKEGKKQVPAELIVDPTRVGNKINLFIRIVDEENRGIKDAKITIVSGRRVITERTDEDGEYLYKFNLRPDEEREIAVYAAGYGDRGFRRTFRGRRIKERREENVVD